MTRQMMASCGRSKSTKAGRILLATPDVKGNRQMKTSPNMSAHGVVNGILRRIVAEKLLIGSRTPLGVIGTLVR